MISRRHRICGSDGVSFVGAGVRLVARSFLVHELFVLGDGLGSGRVGACTCGFSSVVTGVNIRLQSAVMMSVPSLLRLSS